jgi:RNA polymerase sigma-70 factor (ECF subfamily)
MFVSMNTTNEDGAEIPMSDLEAGAFVTEDFAVKQADLETARQFIQSKPEDVQKVFYLMYDVDLPISEIAQALSMSESGVKNKLYRTLKELRSILK